METLREFDARVDLFQTNSVPDEPGFGLPESLEEKVSPRDGALRPFHGVTVAYFLDGQAQELVGTLTEDLYARFGGSLSAPLPLAMAHVTLHDLYASPDPKTLRQMMSASAKTATDLVTHARDVGSIHTTCTAVFNMVNTSVVIGIRATDEGEHRKLLAARGLFDTIVPSGPFTPHITVAYYRPAAPAPLSPTKLRNTLSEYTQKIQGRPILLAPERLHALYFDSMDNYWEVGL
ncbi:2'-5' RNA ligase family protein [Actinomyces sp.]|uniref:2'-5' RNA ligase family protein n=1 Tax=Actinomyces sp. TaxID=29317 RepID=UPI0026DD02AD|nr:hypothetical protein [Actinomyces sp.]MDO4899763.1 hypothetical protein [Actinomyces sp.]